MGMGGSKSLNTTARIAELQRRDGCATLQRKRLFSQDIPAHGRKRQIRLAIPFASRVHRPPFSRPARTFDIIFFASPNHLMASQQSDAPRIAGFLLRIVFIRRREFQFHHASHTARGPESFASATSFAATGCLHA